MNIKDLLPVYQIQEEDKFNYKFTIFTPIYNAQDTITRVHESLLLQTYKNFEWLIINDGATDNSHQRITELIAHSSLQINYVNNVKNRHKMACFMQAIEIAEGEFFLTFDADDECLPHALQVFNDSYNAIPPQLKSTTVAVTGLCMDQNGNQIGASFPNDEYFSDPFKIFAIDKVEGEKWGFTKTSILRNIQFTEEFVQNGFMPEGLIWNLLAKQGLKTLYINEILRIYHTNIENSISSSSHDKTALGSIAMYVSNFNWFFNTNYYKAPLYFMKSLYFLLRESKYSNFNLKNYTMALDSFVIKIFFVLLWPLRKSLK